MARRIYWTRTMTRSTSLARTGVLAFLAALSLPVEAQTQDAAKTRPLIVTVKAGHYAREQTPIRLEISEDRLGPAVRAVLNEELPVVGHTAATVSVTSPDGTKPLGYAQIECFDELRDHILTRSFKGHKGRLPDQKGRVRVTWVLPTPIPAEAEGKFKFDLDQPVQGEGPWRFNANADVPGTTALKYRDSPVFTYNASPVSNPKYKEIQNRDAYIHPAYSPRGALITGDFSPSHPHHRGFFLAYERTKTGDLTPDFWNIHLGTGKIHSEGIGLSGGRVAVRLFALHRWEAVDVAKGKAVDSVLNELWDIEAYDVPGAPYWLFDITSTQQAVDRPMEVLPYRYGGMAYRGPEPFVKGTLDVLTSEGKHRKDGDQKPARWVDLTGPVSEGSLLYAGAMIADHPSNPHYPNVARIHPTTLPFFCYVPAHNKPLTIAVDAPTVFRYRVLIHDGRPDKDLDDRVARDFAEPPVVVVE
jgi:Methane oxygenase PmoA